MRQNAIFLLFLSAGISWQRAFAQQLSVTADIEMNKVPFEEASNITASSRYLNFFVISKRKSGKFDPASRFNVLRSKIRGLFNRKKFVAIVASDADEMTREVKHKLQKRNARIGTIWFDSHGMYKKGYSLFLIGNDEFSYKTLKDSQVAEPMKELAAYSDGQTKLVIGSCYGGATYERSSIDYRDTTRMNGDSLMIQLGKIFQHATIYGSESWVMTKPGLFRQQQKAVAGHPYRKLFRDECYRPVWENLGKWNAYNARSNSFSVVNPITLDLHGNAIVNQHSYSDQPVVRKKVNRKLENLKPWLYK